MMAFEMKLHHWRIRCLQRHLLLNNRAKQDLSTEDRKVPSTGSMKIHVLKGRRTLRRILLSFAATATKRNSMLWYRDTRNASKEQATGMLTTFYEMGARERMLREVVGIGSTRYNRIVSGEPPRSRGGTNINSVDKTMLADLAEMVNKVNNFCNTSSEWSPLNFYIHYTYT